MSLPVPFRAAAHLTLFSRLLWCQPASPFSSSWDIITLDPIINYSCRDQFPTRHHGGVMNEILTIGGARLADWRAELISLPYLRLFPMDQKFCCTLHPLICTMNYLPRHMSSADFTYHGQRNQEDDAIGIICSHSYLSFTRFSYAGAESNLPDMSSRLLLISCSC